MRVYACFHEMMMDYCCMMSDGLDDMLIIDFWNDWRILENCMKNIHRVLHNACVSRLRRDLPAECMRFTCGTHSASCGF